MVTTDAMHVNYTIISALHCALTTCDISLYDCKSSSTLLKRISVQTNKTWGQTGKQFCTSDTTVTTNAISNAPTVRLVGSAPRRGVWGVEEK